MFGDIDLTRTGGPKYLNWRRVLSQGKREAWNFRGGIEDRGQVEITRGIVTRQSDRNTRESAKCSEEMRVFRNSDVYLDTATSPRRH